MGYGDYSHEAHELLSSRRSTLAVQDVFKQRSCHALMDPKGVRARESRDSAGHATSLPVVFALDVTGSMGEIPAYLAREALPKFMKILVDCKVDDPQLLFLAVGDATCDKAPLQVGQFESTAELMDNWLTLSFLEGKGGGQGQESYELALYFLAEHTDTDAWVKRQKRGYIFMTGDEEPYPRVSRREVEAIIGDRLDDDIPADALIARLEETYHPFFLIPEPGRRAQCERVWRELLGDQVIVMERAADTCFVAAGIVALTEGVAADLDVVARLAREAGADAKTANNVVNTLTAYAATLGRDGVPPHRAKRAPAPTGEGPSLWERIKRGIG